MKHSEHNFEACCGAMKHSLIIGDFVTDYEAVRLASQRSYSSKQSFKCCPFCGIDIKWEKTDETVSQTLGYIHAIKGVAKL